MEKLTLHLIRHAKSDWNHEQLSDHDRPLNKRGLRDAPVMADRFLKRFGTPDYWASSSAMRAKSTMHFFAQACGKDENQIQLHRELYHASLQNILDHINSVPSNSKSAVIFGHNPGMSEISTYLSDQFIELPTCCIVSLEFNFEDWRLISARTGNLIQLDYPKNILA